MSVLINFKICDNAKECGGISICPTGALKWNEEKEDTEYKSGFLDVRNGFFTGFIYDDVKVDFFSSGAWDYSELIPVVMNWKMGFARREDGEIVIPCKYEPSGSEGFLWYGYAKVTSGEDGRLLLLDRDGNEVTDDLIFRRGQAFTDYSALRETESVVTIEALGPPMPVLQTETFSPSRVPVQIVYSRLDFTKAASSKHAAIFSVRAGSPHRRT